MRFVMIDHKLTQSDLINALRRKQHKHDAAVAKLERTAVRLERRKAKLDALEAGIAELEQRLAEPRKEHPATSGRNGVLRPAPLIYNPSSGPDSENSADRLARIVTCLRTHRIQPDNRLQTSRPAAR